MFVHIENECPKRITSSAHDSPVVFHNRPKNNGPRLFFRQLPLLYARMTSGSFERRTDVSCNLFDVDNNINTPDIEKPIYQQPCRDTSYFLERR